MEIFDRRKYRGEGTEDSPITCHGKAYTGVVFDRKHKATIYILDGLYHREDGPAYEGADGGKSWWVNGQRHRLDGPAVDGADGYKAWWVDGKRHRLDGPAIELAIGLKKWFVDGQEVDIHAIFGYVPSVPLSPDEQMLLLLSA